MCLTEQHVTLRFLFQAWGRPYEQLSPTQLILLPAPQSAEC